MNITETVKKVYEAEVMLTAEDIEFIIIEHFKQKFDAKTSELSVTFENPHQEDIQVSYRRVEVLK